MSIQNLLQSDINSLNVSCTMSGAIIGPITLNLKRFNNIVYCSLPRIQANTNNTMPAIIITPDTPISSKYRANGPVAPMMTVENDSTLKAAICAPSVNLSSFTIYDITGNNFNGNSGFYETTLVWAVRNLV